jgi:hypothetical protein
MPDAWEDAHGLDKTDPSDAGADADGDLRTNLQEYQEGTDPLAPDTDADGLDDGDEASLGTDPNAADSDGDGLADGDEVHAHGTDPLDEDTDGDGMPDGWEVVNSLDPLLDDADVDTDGDGFSNLTEFAAGSDPTDAESLPPGPADRVGFSCRSAGPGGPPCGAALALLVAAEVIRRKSRLASRGGARACGGKARGQCRRLKLRSGNPSAPCF